MTVRPIGRMSWLVLLPAVVAAAACAGGSSSPIKSGPKPVASAAGGWKVYAPKGGGYRVQIPAGWVTIDGASFAGSSALKADEAKNPGLADDLKGFVQLAQRPGVLLAIDMTPVGREVNARTGFAPNIIVRRIPTGSSQPDDVLLQDALDSGRANAARVPTVVGTPFTNNVVIGGVPGGVVVYSVRLNTRTGTVRMTERDYVVVLDATAYMISCSTVPGDAARMHAECGHALATFDFSS